MKAKPAKICAGVRRLSESDGGGGMAGTNDRSTITAIWVIALVAKAHVAPPVVATMKPPNAGADTAATWLIDEIQALALMNCSGLRICGRIVPIDGWMKA